MSVPGGALVVERIGFGPPLVMLHGWTLDRRMWLQQLPLAGAFTLVGIDRRGFGQSTATADLGAEPDDVLRVADALGYGQFHLLGMSQGGRVALALTRRASGRLLSLALQGTALDGVEAADEAMPLARMTAAALRHDLPAMRALLRGHPLMHATTAEGVQLVAEMIGDYDARDLLVPGQGLPAAADHIAGLKIPVLTIVGAVDTAQRRSNAMALVDAGAKAVTLAHAGHLCNIDAADEYNAAVRANSFAGGI